MRIIKSSNESYETFTLVESHKGNSSNAGLVIIHSHRKLQTLEVSVIQVQHIEKPLLFPFLKWSFRFPSTGSFTFYEQWSFEHNYRSVKKMKRRTA